MSDSAFVDSFPPGPNPKLCPVVLGAFQCQRKPGHDGFHLCVTARRAAELEPDQLDIFS